jgi:hypothetical protein
MVRALYYTYQVTQIHPIQERLRKKMLSTVVGLVALVVAQRQPPHPNAAQKRLLNWDMSAFVHFSITTYVEFRDGRLVLAGTPLVAVLTRLLLATLGPFVPYQVHGFADRDTRRSQIRPRPEDSKCFAVGRSGQVNGRESGGAHFKT